MDQLNKRKIDSLIILGVILCYVFYFIVLRLPLERHVVYVGVDDMIPFWEVFIIPYVIWYPFVWGPLFYFYIKDRESFLHFGLCLVIGMAIGTTTFILYPSMIDFQPQEFPRDNIFSYLVGLMYASDEPHNVLPSMHCYCAVAVWIGLWKSKSLGGKLWVRITSAVIAILICLSTVLIKQHSFVDLVTGVILALIVGFVVYRINWPFHRRFEGSVD